MGFSLPFPRRRAAAKPVKKGENLYRQLGVTEQATYEEITAAYEKAVANYAGDIKQVRKLEVLKDRILEDRLRQRMTGAMAGTVRESPFERTVEKKMLEVPDILKDVILLPEKKHTLKSAGFMVVMVIMAMAAPQISSSILPMSFMVSCGFLYNRGLPEVVRDDMGMPGEVRPTNMKVMGLTIGFVALAATVGYLVSQLWMSYLPMPLGFIVDSFVVAAMSFFMWLACIFLKVQDTD